jgi:release factor glutamine methyltransferase
MMNSKAIFRDLQQRITLAEPPSEIQSLVYIIMNKLLNVSRTDIVAEKQVPFTDSVQQKLNGIITRLNANEPIHYILEEAHFFGRAFHVNPSVLIPRPETELLVEEVVTAMNPYLAGTLVDIGTGSGCIAITLAKELPAKKIIALDVSSEAIKLASKNAHQLNAEVEFMNVNLLTEALPFRQVEALVSNPPYIAQAEKNDMKKNVLEYEPHLALFVPDNNALVFYQAIAEKGYPILTRTGKVFVEINERFGREVSKVFHQAGFKSIRVIKDFQNKDRIVIASKQ